MNLELTDNRVDEVLSQGGITIIDFWAPWCGPCKTYGPIIDEFAHANSEREDLNIYKINVDENQVTAQKHGIRSIPTTIIFKNGQLITKVPGVITKEKLNEFVANLS